MTPFQATGKRPEVVGGLLIAALVALEKTGPLSASPCALEVQTCDPVLTML